MATTMLFSLLLLGFYLTFVNAASFTVSSSCSGFFPMINTSGPGCSVPPFVDTEEFGDNLQSSGQAFIRTTRRGTRVRIDVRGLSRPDYLLTAWIVWADPRGELPEIFEIALLASPLAPTSSAFTSGFGLEPNSLQYRGSRRATIRTMLDFDITVPNSGPLVALRPSFQSDTPGIQDTPYEQFAAMNGNKVPVSASFLRVFDPETGFQILDASGTPETVRSPTSAAGIAVIAHIDRTTHGISPGDPFADHFEVLYFDLLSSSAAELTA